ncbi:MAG TPA: ABC transporter substrate-binding protein [Kofleriaceae bacterium]|nr:ABC transporter substrate-binding protein [Kofleriaceae bacterium]
MQEPVGHCVQLTSADCPVVTGDPTDDKAVLIASLLSVTGPTASSNVPRQQAAIMAVEEINAINASGGILESSTPGDARKLVMVSCDEAANFPRAATHLVTDLQVTAIVGPNLSQDTLDLTTGNAAIGLPSSAQAGTALFTPTSQASAIVTIPDNGLTFMMWSSDVQRVPLLKLQINQLESDLKTARSKSSVKLAIYYRDDALGQGSRDGLTSLMIDGTTLSNAINLGKAREDAYDPNSTDNSALVNAYVAFQPDIVVMVGTAEVIKYFMTPLEAAWPGAVLRPYYLLTDATKVADLLTAVTGNDDLRTRIRGTGVTTTTESLPVYNAFQIAYGQRWKDTNGNPQPATLSGMGTSYDAVYTIALSLVGSSDTHGPGVATGIYHLATNTQTCAYDASGVMAPCFTLSDHARTLYNNMGMLLQNKPVTEIATFGRLEWDAQGGRPSGTVEMWCINAAGPKPIFASAGLTYDIKTQIATGTFTPCAP